uniref:Zinc finger, SWIM-type containing 2 n=1 Tax=Oncorhynchus mykiss TaxID=8022 RepID=A0A8C7PJC1_ONCMY
MFRKTVWKNTVSDAVSWHQDEALNTTMFILKEYGPTGFLLKEEGEPKNFKVFLGDPHTCTCSTFHKERDLCKHICWVLLRKFRLPREHEYCFQQVLVERQILELLQGLHRSRTPRPVHPPCSEADPNPRPDPAEGDGGVRQKEIEAEDVCPICQEELLGKRLPVSYCRFGCGNNVHISCMKVWADHQACPEGEGEAMVKCPLCREDFGPVKLLLEQVRNVAKLHTAAERERPDRHLGVLCNNCRVWQVCTVCRYYHLCEDCIRRCCHPQHAFAIRLRSGCPWVSVCSTHWVNHSDPLPEHLVRSLLSVRVRRGCPLLDPGQQCRICLKSFQQGQQARHLPYCVDPLLRRSNSCPLDGYVIYNPLTWSSGGGKGTPKLASSLDHPKLSEQHRLELFVPGVALLDRAARVVPSLSMFSSEGSADTLVPLPQDTMVVGLQGLCIINTVNIESMEGGKSRTEKDGSPVKSVILNKSLSSQHLRTDVSRVRLGRTNSSSSTKSLAQNNATSTNRLGGVSGGTGRAQPSLFVGVNRSDMTAAAAQTRAVITLWRARPQWKRRPRVPRPSTGDSQQATGLRMTGVLINAPHQGEKE